jgi:hypothetical protein
MELTTRAELVAPVVAWLARRESTLTNEIVEASAGRAAITAISSTKGYWNKGLTVDDLLAHEEQIADRAGMQEFHTTVEYVDWVTRNTGWEV